MRLWLANAHMYKAEADSVINEDIDHVGFEPNRKYEGFI